VQSAMLMNWLSGFSWYARFRTSRPSFSRPSATRKLPTEVHARLLSGSTSAALRKYVSPSSSRPVGRSTIRA